MNPIEEEILQMENRKGLPGEFQRDIYQAVLPIMQKYYKMKKTHMSRYRLLGLAVEMTKLAWYNRKEEP